MQPQSHPVDLEQPPSALSSRPSPLVTVARILLLLALLAGFWWLMGQENQRSWQSAGALHITAGERHYRVPAGEVEGLQHYSAGYFEQGAEQGREALHAHVDAHLDDLFERVEARVPAFLDWYYSLGGEYSRIGMSVFSLMGIADGEFLANRASQILFADADWDGALARLQQRTHLRMVHHDAQIREGWVAGLLERLSPHEVPAPLEGMPRREPAVVGELSLDSVQRQLEKDGLLSLNERLSLSAGGAVAGVTLWRGAARGGAALSGRQVAARGAGRSAGRAGTAAAGGAVTCAPGGPLALACSLAAGTVAWIAFDWALLRTEEALRRDRMETALINSLADFRRNLEAEIKTALDYDLDRHHERLQATVHTRFLPLKGPVPSEGSSLVYPEGTEG